MIAVDLLVEIVIVLAILGVVIFVAQIMSNRLVRIYAYDAEFESDDVSHNNEK